TAAWNGFRPAVAQDHPVLTRIPGTRLFTAYGHYRNGILMAPATAARLTALVTSSWGTA
ncbi:MAG: FAD-dependent oxidoreductase, partial [Bryobacterales bacterium]|nr:FAD-dependent oxidoreductase [Bryobacterales bacterium]